MASSVAIPPAPALNGQGPAVVLGGHRYSVVPQRFGRIKKRLGSEMAGLTDIAFEGLGDFIGQGLERAHAVLSVFMPDLMPVWEFCGYHDEESWASEDIEEAEDVGPTFPEVVDAFQVVMEVNRFDLFKHLGNVVSPELIRAYLNQQVAANIGRTMSSESSSSTPGLDTASMTSGTTSPISPPSEG